jgi:hypothetical protein
MATATSPRSRSHKSCGPTRRKAENPGRRRRYGCPRRPQLAARCRRTTAVALTLLTASGSRPTTGQSPSSLSGARPSKRLADGRGCDPAKSVQNDHCGSRKRHPAAVYPSELNDDQANDRNSASWFDRLLTSAQTASGVTASSATNG